MSFAPEPANLYLEAFAVGILYSLAFCTSTCLPYIASYIAGTGSDFRKGILVTLTYNAGRVTAYATIGGLISIISSAFRFLVDEAAIAPFQEYSTYAFSIITIAIGATMLHKNRKNSPSCNPENTKKPEATCKLKRFDPRAFVLGLSRGLVICPPLLALMMYSVPFTAPADPFITAVLFGLGTAISPLLLLGGVTGWLLNKAPLFRKYIAIGGSAILILLGTATLITAVMSALK